MRNLALPKAVWVSALVLANIALAVFLAMTTMHGPLLTIAMMLGGPAAAVTAVACARRPRYRTAAWLLVGITLYYVFFWSIILFDQRHDQPPTSSRGQQFSPPVAPSWLTQNS